ncbi:MAG TPA: hypothetical protein PK821_02805 [Victivallales bacterium]|nr:hypothetical protein [Victivallales bacterium]
MFFKRKAFLILISAALLINIIVLIFRFYLSSMIKDVVLLGKLDSISLTKEIDERLDKINPPGNLFVRFEGFKSKDGAGWGALEDVASIMYFRMAYKMYPKIVFACSENTKIVRGNEFLDADFPPEKSWLRSKNISGILTILRSPEDGREIWYYQNLDNQSAGN